MRGKWTNERFGDIPVNDSAKITDVMTTMFEEGAFYAEFKEYVENDGDVLDGFLENEGDCTSDYESLKESFINEGEIFSDNEGEDIDIGDEHFTWVGTPKRKVLMTVEMTVENELLNEFDRVTSGHPEDKIALKISEVFDSKIVNVVIVKKEEVD